MTKLRLLLLVVLPLLAASGSVSKQPATLALGAQPITYMDIESAKLTGPSCNYASGRSMAAVVMAMGDVEKLFGRH